MSLPVGEARERVALADAVVLHRRPYRETSVLLDIHAANFGRRRVLAKGARRGRNPQAHLLQPFALLRLSWAGWSELPVLTSVEPAGQAIPLDGAALFCGFYMNELLLHLLPTHDPHPAVFRLYLDTLAQLRTEPCRERVLRLFEAALLEEIGYGLSLDKAAHGDDIDPAKLYAYIVDQGPVEAGEHGAEAVHGATLLGLKQRRLDRPDELREAKRLLRRVLHHHLNGRPLKSRELFKAYATSANP